MQIVEIDGSNALCRALVRPTSLDSQSDVQAIDLSLIGPAEPNDFVLTFLGRATEILDADSADRITRAIAATTLARDGQPFEHLLADLIDQEPQLPPHLRSQTAGETA